MTLFYLVRHGEADWAAMKTRGLQGREFNFVELTQKGIAQIETLAHDQRLPSAELIVSSPYTRALQSAAILCRKLRLPLQVEYDLHEWRFSRDATMPFNEEVERRRQLFRARDPHTPWLEPSDWESAYEVRLRVEAALRKYLHYEAVIVAAHEGVIYSLTRKMHTALGEVEEFTLKNKDTDKYG